MPTPKIPDATIAAIKHARNTRCPCCGMFTPIKLIAAKYGVCAGTVSRIANGRYPR